MFINLDFVQDKCKLKVRKTFIGKFQIFCSENKNKKRVMRFLKKFHPPLLSVAVGFISVTPTSDKRGEQVVDWLLVDFWLDWFLVGSRAGSQSLLPWWLGPGLGGPSPGPLSPQLPQGWLGGGWCGQVSAPNLPKGPFTLLCFDF